MAETESAVRSVGVSDLRGIIVDSDELKKGTKIFDDKGISNLARHDNKVFAEAAGSGSAPYRVSLAFSNTSQEVRARCTCMAARSRPFCKHAAALLVAWSRAPESFVVSEGPPAGAGGEAKKKTVKKGATETKSLMKEGVDQVGTLVRELATSGVATIGEDRPPQIQKLGENLRENKLRRLSAKTLDLAHMLDAAVTERSLPAIAYMDLVADLLLTAKKLDKHLGGEAIDDKHVEELIGKTWKKDDRKPVSGLDLVEYAYLTRTTSDDYVIRESRFFDVTSGSHFAEKQIVPRFLAKSTDPKRSRAGDVLLGVRGSTYPGYAPIRLDVADLGDPKPLDHATLEKLADKALPSVGAALSALQEHRKDVFAPDLVPVAVKVDTLFSRKGRMQAVDTAGDALHIANDAGLEERLGSALRGAKLVALLGDVGIEAALPTLWPHAVVAEGPLGLVLTTLVAPEGAESAASAPPEGSAAWNAAAREAGASTAAIALAEVREELADAFVLGLGSLGPRTADPLAARLKELGMAKQAALLEALAQKPDAESKLDELVKLYQILGIALVRLAGATTVDRSTMTPVPTYESVFVEKPAAWLSPRETARERGAGHLNRYEAAVHYAHYYESLTAEELSKSVYPTWADGSAMPYVVRAFAGKPEEARAAATTALVSKGGRVAKITAIRVLESLDDPKAHNLLAVLAEGESDAGIRGIAADARDAVSIRKGQDRSTAQTWRKMVLQKASELTQQVLSATTKDVREMAVDELVRLGARGSIPVLRQAFFSDPASGVRKAAAMGLAQLGDTEMVETFVEMLKKRDEDDREAKLAADALGRLGDARGLEELLAAFREGYKPAVVGEALRAMGPAALEPLLDVIDREPKLVERKVAIDVVRLLAENDVEKALVERLTAMPKDDSFAPVAAVYLKLSAGHPGLRRAVGKAVLELLPDPEGNKALVKAAKKAAN